MKQATIRKFSSIQSPPLAPSTPGTMKKSVPGPSSPMHVLSLLLFTILRRPMNLSTSTKAGFYLCAAAGGALIFDFFRMPSSYFSNKYNLFNQLFVKWAWAWTCCILSAFVIFSSFVYTGGNVRLIRAHIVRIVFGTGCWYSITGLINLIHDLTGHCNPSTLMLSGQRPVRRTLCNRAAGTWIGFDISGHCFLLTMCSLWIMEELRCMHYWSRLAQIVKPYEASSNNDDPASSITVSIPRHVSAEEFKIMRSAFRRLTGSIRLFFSIAACLSMIWDFMFITTIIYFHNMPSKLLGTLLGVMCWFIAYRVIFPSAKTGRWFGLSPGMPGESPVDFTPRR